MKSLIASVAIVAACSFSATAFAQSNGADTGSQAPAVAAQSAAVKSSHHWYSFLRHGANQSANRGNECVGPAGFCNIYFGS
jgi:hypothetical protein